MSAEAPMSFRESLPPYARAYCWLPTLTVTLTLTLPDGAARLFHVKRCIQTQQLAHNVAQVWPQEDNP